MTVYDSCMIVVLGNYHVCVHEIQSVCRKYDSMIVDLCKTMFDTKKTVSDMQFYIHFVRNKMHHGKYIYTK